MRCLRFTSRWCNAGKKLFKILKLNQAQCSSKNSNAYSQCCHVCRRADTLCAITASLLACTPRYDLWHQLGYWVSFDSSGLKSGRCKTVTVRSRWISIEDSPQASMACPSCEETITEDSISFLTWKQLVFVSFNEFLPKKYTMLFCGITHWTLVLERSVRLNLSC